MTKDLAAIRDSLAITHSHDMAKSNKSFTMGFDAAVEILGKVIEDYYQECKCVSEGPPSFCKVCRRKQELLG